MARYLILLLLLLKWSSAGAQCLTNSLVINTGYDPITATAITPGINGGTPVPDPYWRVTYESPGIATALISTGLTLVPIGANADIITTLGGWISSPPGTPAGWISCLNSNTYTTDGTGPSGTVYLMTLTRSFRMCSADSITLDFYIADDNFISAIDVDGVLTTFSQPPIADVTTFTSFAHFTQTFYLGAGVHNINVLVHNYNEPSSVPNPTGLLIHGTLTSATALNSMVSESFASCSSFTCTSTCNTISLVDTLHQCAGDVITLPATLVGTDPVLSITWSPATGLSSTTIMAPTLTVGSTSSYYNIVVRSLIPFNLVTNGNFSAGNTGFTSSYLYTPGPSGILLEGHYSVYNNPFSVHGGFTSFGDHTTGTGQMMIINGSPTPTDVWCQTIPVSPNTDYDFSAWIANCSSVTTGPDIPILQFRINGILIGTPTPITSAPGVWTNFFSTWNSGTSTTANICIYDMNTTAAGNDFAIDDISFREICIARDSVFIDVAIPDTTTTNEDTILCATGAPLTLTATPGYASYLWSTGSTATSISPSVSGTYWVYNTNNCSVRIDSFHITYIPVPVINLGNDTAFCITNTLVLSSPQPPGSAYIWSTGSTGDSIHVSTSGTYWVEINNVYCTASDTIHVTVSPFPVVDLGPDMFNCTATAVTLGSSVTYTSPTYLWSGGGTTSTITVPVSGTYWLRVTVGGCPVTDTINVTIVYDTFTLYNTDTAICRGMSVQGRVTAHPDASFQWVPTAGIPTPTAPTPMITPDTSAMYYVRILMPGCPDHVDSFYIDVQPVPDVFAGGSKTVCEFDTVHLHASVTPNWYTHYTYSWTPATFLRDSTQSSVVFRGGDTSKIVLTVTTPRGCMGADSLLIWVFPGNFAKLDTSVSICPRDSVQLMPLGGISYSWHPGLYLSDSTADAPWIHAITTQDYWVVATSQYGCTDTVTAHVRVHAGGQIFLGDSVTIYPGESYHIEPKTNCVTFEWNPHAGLDDAFSSNPLASPQLSTKYIVIGKTQWGCEVKDSINIYVNESTILALPNAFAPGSANGKFFVIKRGEGSLKHFRIFNRWGNKVFETSDIDEGWDGTYNGKPQPFGVYVYQVEAVTNTGKVFQRVGNVTLIR